MTTKMTCAEYRIAARIAERDGDYARAATLFDRAADMYPFPPSSALGQRDIAALRESARICRATHRADNPEFADRRHEEME